MTSTGNPDRYQVRVSAGTLRADGVRFPHRWSEAGVSVQADFTGAHLLHVAVAGCVLNDVYREASRRGLTIHGVLVTARGSFDSRNWHSTGITYDVEIDSPAEAAEVQALLEQVDQEAEIPRAVRAGAEVRSTRSSEAETPDAHQG